MLFHGATKVDNFNTVEEKLEAAGLNFLCEKKEAYFKKEEEYELIANQFHIMRTDTGNVISKNTVSDGYKILQNIAAFSWLDDLDTVASSQIEYAGAFQDGALVYMAVRQGKVALEENGAVLNFYVLLTNGHIGNKALVVKPIVTSTLNGTTVILGSGSPSSKVEKGIRHTKNMIVSMFEGASSLKAFNNLNETFKETARELSAAPCTKESAVEMFKSIFGITEDSPDLTGRAETGLANKIAKFEELFLAAGGKSCWHAYHASCEFITTERSTRRANKDEDVDTKRLESTLYGANSKTLNIALVHALGLV